MEKNNGRWFWQRYASVYDLFMSREKKAYDRLGALIKGVLTPESHVLELAAGTGLVAQHVGGSCASYLVTDYAEKMLSRAQRKSWPDGVAFEQADATDLRYAEGQFDAVIIANALHIMPDPVLALQNIRHVLRQGGKLIAPTFMRSGTKKETMLEKPMQWLGFRSWTNWSQPEYLAFLRENGWIIQQCEVVPASFHITFVVAE